MQVFMEFVASAVAARKRSSPSTVVNGVVVIHAVHGLATSQLHLLLTCVKTCLGGTGQFSFSHMKTTSKQHPNKIYGVIWSDVFSFTYSATFLSCQKKTGFFEITRAFLSNASGYGKLQVNFGKVWLNRINCTTSVIPLFPKQHSIFFKKNSGLNPGLAADIQTKTMTRKVQQLPGVNCEQEHDKFMI